MLDAEARVLWQEMCAALIVLPSHDLGAAELIDPVHCKYGLGEINPEVDNGHGFSLRRELMRFETPSWHLVADCRDSARLSRDGEVPFIR